MQCHADVDTRVVGRLALYGFNDAGDRVGGRGKAALVLTQALGSKARAHVKGRQQGQAYAGALCGAHQGQGHLGRVGIGAAIHVVLQVLEFADLGVAALQ